MLESHFGWDPGAAIVGRMLAKEFDAPLHLGRWSRLVVDLNRSSFHPRLIARTLEPGAKVVPGNRLDRVGRRERRERYWRPWRDAVFADLEAAIESHGRVLHISVHSFTHRLGREVRDREFGLLYKPSRPVERAFADRLHARLDDLGHRVWRNRPYSGLDDGHCMRLRAELPVTRYVGMEIEMNQRDVGDAAGARRLGRAVVAALRDDR